jgi:predicted AlkP superfamily pyrophosphatase or phosphodiesterase
MNKQKIVITLFFLLTACAPQAGTTPLETATSAQVMPEATATLTAIPPLATVPSTPRPLAERVLIISFDGLRPDAIGKAPMTNLIALMQTSAYTLSAQTILPSSTLPSHASMLTGLCPSKHAVYWNDYVPENGYALGTDLFDIAHAAGLRTVMIVGKEKLRQITEPASTDVFIFKEADQTIANLAVAEIKQGFGLMFIHFPSGDYAGHEHGWMGGIQMWTFREEDELLAQILTALDENGLRASTLIILTADHGGYQHSHGGDLPEETTIPWIVNGPGVIPGPLTSFVQTTDTAATAAYMLGLPLPADWDGVPVYEAFGQPTPVRIPPACLQTH